MKRVAGCLAYALCVVASNHALAQTEALAPSRAEATLVGPNPSYVGQMVQIEVELLRDDRAKDKPAPFFPEIEVRDAITVLAGDAPPPETRTIDGVTFLGQKRRYLVFPQTDGKLVVPPIQVALPGPDDNTLSVATKPLELHADVPAGAGARLPLVAQNVRLERSIDGDLDHLRVGESFTVSLRLVAEDTDPVMLPSLELPEIDGLSRYPGQGSSQAKADRGTYQAERVTTTSYVASDWGLYELPRASVFWLDPSTGKYAEAAAPAVSFRARINPKLGAGCVGGPGAAARMGGGLTLLGLVVLLGVRRGRRIAAERAARARVKKTADERAAFAALRKAAHAGHDAATLTALYRWLPFALPGGRTLSRLRSSAKEERLSRATVSLEVRVSTGHGDGQALDVVPPLETYRKGVASPEGSGRLPDLNGPPTRLSGLFDWRR